MESSGYYLGLIQKYEGIISQIGGLYGYLGNCSSVVSQSKSVFEETQIDGESIDKGVLDETLSVLENLKSAFNTVIAECKLKIATNEVLYNAAKQREASTTKC